jgi:hypothetical protein
MVEVDANLALIGPHGPITLIEVFEGRRQLVAYYFVCSGRRRTSARCRTRCAALPDIDRFVEIGPRILRWRADAPVWLDVEQCLLGVRTARAGLSTSFSCRRGG